MKVEKLKTKTQHLYSHRTRHLRAHETHHLRFDENQKNVMYITVEYMLGFDDNKYS